MFRVGQKVVCVRGPLVCVPSGVIDATIGEVYTVRGFYVSPLDGQQGMHLDEIHNPTHSFTGMEYGFYPSRFRPVVERKTDISVFQKMLTDHRLPAPADTSRETV